MIKLLLMILVGFVVYSMVTGLRRQVGGKGPKNRTRDGERMVEDPQCRTYLPISDALNATINGKEHYFCSKKCLREYKKTH